MSYESVGELLEAMSDADAARKLRSQVRPLRGVRGVALGEVARIGAAAWEEDPPSLPGSTHDLSALFSTAFEDGLVAIGLLASCVPDAPGAVLDLGLDWVGRVDDTMTADALGWLVLGPAALASGQDLVDALSSVRASGSAMIRRAAVMAGMAALPVPIEGPSAAPIRARLASRQVQWVDAAQSPAIDRICSASLRDEAPQVRKALRRLLRTWAQHDPAAAASWGAAVRGGLPKMLRGEVEKAARKAKRLEGSE